MLTNEREARKMQLRSKGPDTEEEANGLKLRKRKMNKKNPFTKHEKRGHNIVKITSTTQMITFQGQQTNEK